MITLKNVQTLSKKVIDLEIISDENHVIDATGLTLLPGLIDPHVHFRTPGAEHKEDWMSGAKAALRGGFTTVFDMPNTSPATVTKERFDEKKKLIQEQLKAANLPLRHRLYFGVDKKYFHEIEKIRRDAVALKIFMGTSTGDLLMDDESSLHAAFSIASSFDMLVCVHAEDEEMIQENAKKQKGSSYDTHSKVRTPLVAKKAVQLAIRLARLYKTRLHILHVSTKDEIDEIAKAKKEGVKVTCEVTPHHLFLNTDAYKDLEAKAQVNPPLRDKEHQAYLFEAIKNKIIDTVGSDHAPHTLDEKSKPYGQAPSGMPGVETTLPLLLTAYHEGKLELDDIVSLCSTRVQEIYRVAPNEDVILVDLNMEKTIQNQHLATKCKWSPYAGMKCKGFPVYAVAQGRLVNLQEEALCKTL